MSMRAWIYVGSILLLGTALSAVTLWGIAWNPALLVPFGCLVGLATLAHLYKAEAPNRIAYFATPVFLFAGLLLLPQAWFVLLVALPHLTEWVYIKLRRPQSSHLGAWYIQPFNIAMHVVAGSTAAWIMTNTGMPFLALTGVPSVLAMLLAAACYLLVNQLLLGQALLLAREITWRDSGVLHLANLLPEFINLCLGGVVARLWTIDPGYIIPALLPLLLMYRALLIPLLQQEAQTDGKTGLANARYYKKRFTEELDRAKRFNRPLVLIMADLDLLRNINNTYGHLAGDAVLEGIGKLIRQSIREYDIAGRFGGEEFAIVLPETTEADARLLAERLRREIEAASFTVPTSETPIRATMSLGIAAYPDHATSQEALVQAADVAVYQAKFHGRNRVMSVTDVPQAATLEHASSEEVSSTTYAAAFVKHPRTADQPTGSGRSTTTAESNGLSDPSITASAGSTTAGMETSAAGAPQTIARSSRRRTDLAKLPDQPGSLGVGIVVTATVVAGIVVALFGGVLNGPAYPFYSLLMLAGIAFVTELMQINVYGEYTLSVSLALTLAATLIDGMAGTVIVSAAVVVADQLRRQRPLAASYKVAFNWATHVLAAAPLVLIGVRIPPTQPYNPTQLAFLVIVATLCYYMIETGLLSVVIGLTTQQSPRSVWRKQFRWLAGHYVGLGIISLCASLGYQALGPIGIGVFVIPLLLIRFAQQQYVQRTQANVQELKRMNQELSRANAEVNHASQSIRQINQELFLKLGSVLDARDPYVTGHAAQVARYATLIATELGLPPAEIDAIYQSGFLHDIGKIALSEQILFKPTKLTAEEYETVKTHPTIGAAMLEMSQTLRPLAPFVRHHHERWDGTGYPDKLAGEQIPIVARILSVCDAVEAMAADRPYQEALALPEILAEVRRGAGTQFDPQIVEIFIRIIEREGATLVVNSTRDILRKQDLPGLTSNCPVG